MATNPILSMTVIQLKAELADYQDMVSMMNSGASGAEIAAKYGHYPDSTKEAMVTVNSIKAELAKRGEPVDGLPNQQYNWKNSGLFLLGATLVIIGFLGLVGKLKSI